MDAVAQADQTFSKERPIISRWGHPIADDYGYVDIPGWILRNYHKCGVTPLEMMFVTHVMAFKYDRKPDQPENAAKPSLPTIARYMGRDTSNVRRVKQGLIKKRMLTVTSSKGKADEYNFAGLTNRCLQYELLERETPSKTTTGKNAGGAATPGKITTPVPPAKLPAEDSEVSKDLESNTSLSHPAAGASDATGAPDAPDKAVEPEAKRESTDAKQPTAVKEGIEEPTPSSAAPLPAAALVTASKKTKAEKPKSDLPPASTDVKNMIALECYGTVKAWDYPQNATAMMKAYKDCKAPTVDQLKAHQRWWNVNDFRGRKGQRPKPHQVAETWAEFLVSQEGSTNGNTNASPVHANAFRVPKGFGGRKD